MRPPPEINSDGTITVTEDMLRPFDPNKFVSQHNYSLDGNILSIDNGSRKFVDESLSKEDNCSFEFYDVLKEDIFEYNNKIYITNRRQLNEFSKVYKGRDNKGITFVLTKDIDLCRPTVGVPAFYPIGIPKTNSEPTPFFLSTFDGDNHIVKNLFIEYKTTDRYNCTGFICGMLSDYTGGVLQNIGVQGDIIVTAGWQREDVAHGVGLVGFSVGSDIKNVVSNINITGLKNVGGVVGLVTPGEARDNFARPANVINVKSYGKVKGKVHAGGVVGYARSFNGREPIPQRAKSVYKGVVNWGTVSGNDASSTVELNSTTIGGLFGTYDNHDNMTPISCRNGGNPTNDYGAGATIVPFTCD